MIRSYNKENKEYDKITLLKKISSVRNKHIVSKGSISDLWSKNISNLKQKYDIVSKGGKEMLGKNDDVKDKLIEKGFISLLKKYKYDWGGLWSIFKLDKNGKIKDINVFDIDDFNHIVDYINNQ